MRSSMGASPLGKLDGRGVRPIFILLLSVVAALAFAALIALRCDGYPRRFMLYYYTPAVVPAVAQTRLYLVLATKAECRSDGDEA